ncbi:MAG: oligosaccharide flippase family protein [Spirochaetia bacterium]|nr:oligosaccharide flippase family protein [Spirochaetia bacterium]
MISIGKASVINGAAKYSTVILNILFTAVLARILSPEDYGIVAITAVFTVFFGLFADVGLGAGVIQNQKLTKENIDEIFSFNTFLAVVLALLFCLVAGPIASFYNIPVLKPICCLLSIALFFNTMNSIPNAVLMKQQKFMLVGMRTIFVCLFTGIITIILAFCGLKYYALVLQSIISAFFIFVWNMVSTKLRFTLRIHRASFAGIKSYSFWQFLDKFVNYFSRNTDHFLIGKFLGQVPLGYYDKSYKLMLYPVQNFTHVISPVMHPILAVHQDDKDYIYRKYLKVMKVLSLFGIYITVLCFFCSREAILIVFGRNWTESVSCFQILSLAIWAQMTTSSTGAIFQSIGETRKMFVATFLASVVMVLFTLAGLGLGTLEALSFAVAIAFNISFVLNYYVLMRYGFHKPFLDLVRYLLPDLAICGGIFIVMAVLPIHIGNLFLSAVVKGAVMTLLFILGMWATGQKGLLRYAYRKVIGRLICKYKGKKLRNMVIKEPLRSSTEKGRIIVSLTSFPARLDTLDICIKSLFAQSVKPDKIVLYLGTECDDVPLPGRLTELEKYGLEVKKGYADIRPHKKYLFAMQEYPGDFIITVDDDLMYDRNMIKSLLESYKRNPNAVSARRVHRITSLNGDLEPYDKFDKCWTRTTEPSHMLLSTNGAGTLFPPGCLPEEAFDIDTIKKLCLDADDIWIKFMLIKKGVPVVWVKSHQSMPPEIPGTQKIALYYANTDKENSNNDRCIQAMEEHFNIHLADYSYRR